MGTIIWVDSDPNINTSILKKANFNVVTFTEVQPAMTRIQNGDYDEFVCVITSTMKRGGRAEKGLPNGFQLADFVVQRYADRSHKPLLSFITASADEQEVLERGFTIFVKYDRAKMLTEVVRVLEGSQDRDFRLVRKPGRQCGFEMRGFARKIAESVCPNFGFPRFHNAFTDLCFCAKCEPNRILWRGGEKYALPIGWFGFGIIIRDDFQRNRCEIENWHVAYHGTGWNVVESILNEQRLMFPGDRLKDGTVLKVAHGGCNAEKVSPDGKVIYISPTIHYASHPVYAKPFKFDNRRIQTVFQCRVKPGSYGKFPETLGGTRGVNDHIDPDVRARGVYDTEFSQSEVEWISADRSGVVPYRLLIRWFD